MNAASGSCNILLPLIIHTCGYCFNPTQFYKMIFSYIVNSYLNVRPQIKLQDLGAQTKKVRIKALY